MVSIYFSKSPIKSTEFKAEHINNALTIPLFIFLQVCLIMIHTLEWNAIFKVPGYLRNATYISSALVLNTAKLSGRTCSLKAPVLP